MKRYSQLLTMSKINTIPKRKFFFPVAGVTTGHFFRIYLKAH